MQHIGKKEQLSANEWFFGYGVEEVFIPGLPIGDGSGETCSTGQVAVLQGVKINTDPEKCAMHLMIDAEVSCLFYEPWELNCSTGIVKRKLFERGYRFN